MTHKPDLIRQNVAQSHYLVTFFKPIYLNYKLLPLPIVRFVLFLPLLSFESP